MAGTAESIQETRAEHRSLGTTISTVLIVGLVSSVGVASLFRGAGDVLHLPTRPALGVAFLLVAALGIVSLRRERTARVFGVSVAVAATLFLFSEWRIAETGSDVSFVVERCVALALLLTGLVALLAPACTGIDAGAGDDLPAVRRCEFGHRYCFFHSVALPVAPEAVVASIRAEPEPLPDVATPLAS